MPAARSFLLRWHVTTWHIAGVPALGLLCAAVRNNTQVLLLELRLGECCNNFFAANGVTTGFGT